MTMRSGRTARQPIIEGAGGRRHVGRIVPILLGLLVAGCHRHDPVSKLVPFRIGGIAVTNPEKPAIDDLEPGGALGYAIHIGAFQKALRAAGYDYQGLAGFPRTAAALLGLSSGQVQVATTGDSPAILSRARGDKQRAIWIGLPTGDTWIVARKDGPTSLKQLSGRRVGVLFGSTFHYLIRRAAEREGVTGIDYAQLQAPVALRALKRGDIDAYGLAATTAELWRVRFGLPVIARIGSQYPDLQGVSVVTARSDFLAAHPTFAAAFWQGLKAGIDAIRKDPEAYYRWNAEKTGIPLEIVRATAVERYADTPFAKEGEEALERLLDFQLKTGLAKSSFSIADWAVGPAAAAGEAHGRP